MDKMMYTHDQLYSPYKKKTYTSKHTQAAFLLGGIGTGNFSVGARGEFRDWEIFNTPGKGNTANYTFFAIHTKEEGKEAKSKILESRLQPHYLNSSIGYSAEKTAGIPRFEHSEMTSEYPFVNVELRDEDMPVTVSMEAFTPFIPLNPDDSGIPAAIIRYKVKNITDQQIQVGVAGSMTNLIGFIRNSTWGFMEKLGKGYNEKRIDGELKGVFMGVNDLKENSVKYGNLALMTREDNATLKPNWYDGAWWDGIHEFWDDFSEDGQLNEEMEKIGLDSQKGHRNHKVGSVAVKKTLDPGAEKTFEFVISWYVPNRPSEWSEDVYNYDHESDVTIKNYYATQFKNSWAAGEYLIKNLPRLEEASRRFTKALYSTTLPGDVIESIANNMTVIRSTTCFRIEGGHFMAWEGSHDQFGSCFGTCTHVWNYAQTMAFLFPTLEQSARETEFNIETDENGRMAFRTDKHFAKPTTFDFIMHPAADGQMGTIVRLYREWKISGNDDFLKGVWQNAKKALNYAFDNWDSDGDFVLDSQQHNTYDIEFYGPNSLVNTVFFAALKAGAKMAEYLGDEESATKYREAFEKAHERMDAILWSEEFGYYPQQIENVNQYKYQYGKGCLSDQLFGQTLAHVAGLGYILPEKHVKRAVKSIFDYNFRTTMKDHVNVQRTYALNDEAGLLLCSWPNGGRPKLPFVYSDEVWSGIEYQVATNLIYEGYIDEGLTINKACRERYDGIKRNPWSDIECGHHYARSLASWGLLIGLSGFSYDMTKDEMDFEPKINADNFKTFWSNGKAWGTYTQKMNKEGQLEKQIDTLYTL